MSEQSGAEEGYRVLSLFLAGLLLYGGLGWLVDRWLRTTAFLPLGLIVGAGLAVFLIVRRHAGEPSPRTDDDPDDKPDGKETR